MFQSWYFDVRNKNGKMYKCCDKNDEAACLILKI